MLMTLALDKATNVIGPRLAPKVEVRVREQVLYGCSWSQEFERLARCAVAISPPSTIFQCPFSLAQSHATSPALLPLNPS